MSVLHNWRTGLIPQRPSVKTVERPSKRRRKEAPQALSKVHKTPAPPPIQKRPNEPRAVQKLGNGKFPARLPNGLVVRKLPDHMIIANVIQSRPITAARPAQLEVDERKRSKADLFHTRKRLLDSVYSGDRVEKVMRFLKANRIEHTSLVHGTSQPMAALLPPPPPPPSRKPLRQKARPNRIDLEAPQYRHANDPLPQKPLSEPKQVPTKRLDGKLLGLGPYGTVYTHHFEIFPLDFGVYFHQSTLLGSGIVEACHGGNPKMTVTVPKRADFDLDGMSLHWGPFDAKVFSELGIALDFVADQLEATFECGSFQNSWKLVNAATFLLNYFQDSASSSEEEVVKSLAARTGECLLSFDERIRLQTRRIIREPEECEDVLRIYDRLLLVALIVFTTCRGLPPVEAERLQIEDCLQKLCQTMLSLLFGLGVGQLRRLYEECSQTRYRQRGLRNDAQVIHSWVLVMKTLEVAQIPEVSFWDLVQAEIASPQVLSSCDARELESSWEALFTLLPLTEFDNFGILIHGQRHKATSDGWRIPQKLLKRVFQMYEENNRQLPSFNSYCRALIGRCHHIVQHWGWRRSTLAVGAIFDLFGNQKMIGLRHEEIHGSPRFLEDLNGRPNLDIEVDDHCFHVFLKLVALSIHKLSKVGASKDILNLSTRVMPNHGRQYLKEEKFRARDLMALRNHHDLLCTLFWACPPGLRPSVSIMEGLVMPTRSHQEACLVNISCWNRISQYLVRSGEACRSFEPFRQWRNRFFSQTLRQVDSVSKDVQKQLLSLNRNVSRSIGQNLVRMTISSNEAAVSEVLQASATASLDVIKHAPDLETAAVVFNTPQLQSVFQRFSSVTPKLSWGLLSVCLETLETYLERVDGSRRAEESQGSDEHISDSVLTVDRDLEESFFSMARCVLSCSGTAVARPIRTSCFERIVTLAARMGVDYINADAWRLSDLFKGGKYGLFKGPVHKLSLEQRQVVPLLMASLLKHGLDHPLAVDMNLLDLWILSIVKPREFCSHEMQFARELIRHGKTFVSPAAKDLAVEADYGTNKDLFKFAMTAMRQSVRRSDPSSRKSLVAERSRVLKQVMEQIKNDLTTLSASGAAGHSSYILFVQEIMSLIKTHGSDFCTVDGFFLHFSKAYSPSARDPALRLAGLISYGLQLEEGDGRIVQPLFYLLLNNVKFAIGSNKMNEEVAMLRGGMRNAGILDFILGRMVPVVIRCCYRNSTAFPMLDVYAQALRMVLTAKTAPQELDENNLAHFNRIMGATVEGMANMARSSSPLTVPQLHVVRQSMALLNLLWPTLYAVRVSGTGTMRGDMFESLRYLRYFASLRRTTLAVSRSGIVPASEIFAGVINRQPLELAFGIEADIFTDTLTRDVDKNWLYRGGASMSIQLAGNRTRSEVRIQTEQWDARSVVKDLESRMREWAWWWHKTGGRSMRARLADSLVF
ncbi:Protein mms22 [Ophiocordyceps camponoti-floridani]|uniref:Protein mms22 n=1 Tax=Ophiocordyceps camponoti-floridani TaxID=2030778 RepID=A0A8H4VDE0_9HYPO|nr:Protein mms22 [Ophiocordyceps camponoti-floridani]